MGLPFNRGFTPGHEYMGTVVKLGATVNEFQVGDRVTVEVHAGCGRCQPCREGMLRQEVKRDFANTIHPYWAHGDPTIPGLFPMTRRRKLPSARPSTDHRVRSTAVIQHSSRDARNPSIPTLVLQKIM
jgi:hypothetical protein